MSTPAGSSARAFAAARLLRELARDVHGNLAALGVAPLATDDAALAADFESLNTELNAIAVRLAELRERSAAIAEAHVATNASSLKPNFGYRITSRDGVKEVEKSA